MLKGFSDLCNEHGEKSHDEIEVTIERQKTMTINNATIILRIISFF